MDHRAGGIYDLSDFWPTILHLAPSYHFNLLSQFICILNIFRV